MSLAELRTDAVILACAISAGIHAALVPDHFAEGTGAGVGFVVAAVLLSVLAVALTRRPTPVAFGATAAGLGALIAAYALAVTTGLPVLHPEPEPVDDLALFAKAVEAAGLVLALGAAPRLSLDHTKGTLA